MQSNGLAMKLRRILVPIDFSDSTARVLQYAAAFAGEFKTAITLLHVVKPDGSHVRRNIPVERLVDEMGEAGETQLRKLVAAIWGDDIATDIVVATGKPYRQIINEAKEMNSDLIIMAGPDAVGSWGLFRRDTTTKVVRRAPCPVLVVPALERGFMVGASVEKRPDR